MTCSFPPSLFLPQAEVQPFSPTSSSSNNNAATSSVADSNSLNSSSSAKTFVACKVCGDKASGNFSLSSHQERERFPLVCIKKLSKMNFPLLFHSIRISLRSHLMRRLQGESEEEKVNAQQVVVEWFLVYERISQTFALDKHS